MKTMHSLSAVSRRVAGRRGPCAASRESGSAILTAIWMTIIGVMLVTSLATLIQSNVSLFAHASEEARARMAAVSGINQAIAYLIADRPKVTTEPGIVITEVLLQGMPDTLVITQVQNGVTGGLAKEYVEIFNPTPNAVSLSGLNLRKLTSGGVVSLYATLDASHVIQPYSYYLYTSSTYDENDYVGSPASDYMGTANTLAATDNAIRLQWGASGHIIDTVGWGTVTGLSNLLPSLGTNLSVKRCTDARTGFPKQTYNNAIDFLAAGTDTSPRNSTISLPANSSDRKYEFIEIQNVDSIAHTLNAAGEEYWISVGTHTPVAADMRYIHVHPGAATQSGQTNVLAAGAVGVIVPIDADTPTIAALSGKTTSEILWFSLDATTAGPARDTWLSGIRQRALGNRGDSIILGRGAAASNQWYGDSFPARLPGYANDAYATSATNVSWQKISPSVLDDTIPPYSGFFPNNWETKAATPGVGLSSFRAGIDGATDTMWYRMNYAPWTLYDTGSYDVYYRTRVFDEAGKINVNYIVKQGSTSWESGVFRSLLKEIPNPPFTRNVGFTAADAEKLTNALAGPSTVFSRGVNADSMLTPTSVFMIWDATATIRRRNVDSAYVPFLSVYGYAQDQSFPININTAESPVLRAGMYYALAGLGSSDSKALADSIYNYLTKNDVDSSNDTVVYNMADVSGLAGNVADKNALDLAYANGALSRIFATSSNNYFMIYSTGFVFKKGADPDVDTPAAQFRIACVVRRYADSDKADILWWRETFEVYKTGERQLSFPIGARRYPKYRFDPSQ